ncbi:hypothetical protein [Pseudomonas sp. 6D_7.1_Bac1]|uniref:hypothetical protein n=1 Tax=Pseudomonas sp. 6D_7.1_Bac1 TaxID=2971615 RepID=UPI0021CA8B18|nr:hypothetical protein [Pseudomonas sp. 6D_7.1_Bac1]MCU1751291.1 hypothetical protein [Pseudomonas sp. 6D_7.1_Bac1]
MTDMTDMTDDPIVQGWAAPTFSKSLAGTVQPLPLTVRLNFPINRNGKWKVHIYNPGYQREMTGTHNGYYYEFVIDNLIQGSDCEIHTQFDAQGVWSDWAFSGKFRVIKPPVFSTPTQNATVDQYFTAEGAGAYPYAKIYVRVFPQNLTYPADADGSGRWSVWIPNLPLGYNEIGVIQVFESVESSTSGALGFYTRLTKPLVITSPETGDVVRELRPEVSGTGHDGTTITIFREGGGGGVYGSGTVVNGIWKIKLTQDLPVGAFVFHAEAKIGTTLVGWSNTVPVTVRYPVPNAPAITVPGAGTVQNQTFTVSGAGGAAGATVEILKDFADHTVIGTGPVKAGGSWDVTVTVPPGPVSLVAEQFIYSDEHSARSAPRTFKIRPSRLVVNVAYPNDKTVRFSGAGYTRATVEIWYKGGGGGIQWTATVVGSSWQKEVIGWVPGSYVMSVLQKVSDGSGGWIDSEWSNDVSVAVPVPKPTLNQPTDLPSQMPGFSGTGTSWTGQPATKVDVWLNGAVHVAVPQATVNGSSWTVTAAQKLAPGTYSVKVRQVFDSKQSDWVELPGNMIVPAPLPTIESIVENGLSPDISGTCWPNAVVTLKFSDNNSATHPAIVNGGNWTFRRDTPFATEVTHTVTVTQTAGEQTSSPATRTFTVNKPLLKPVITQPQKDQEVGRDLTVRGRDGVKGATMKLRDAQFERPLGEKLLTSDGDWSIELKDLAFRKYTIDAIQVIGQRESLRSDYCFFEVVVVPPNIEVPAPGGDLPRTSTLSGTGLPGARVEVWLQGNAQPLLSNILVGENGHWEGEVTLPIGAKTIWARQTLGDERPSKDSPPLNYRVVPALPFIETPGTNERVGRWTVVSGFGYPGDTVAVALAAAPQTVLGRAPVLDDRTWSVPVELDRPGGTQRLIAVQSRDGFDSRSSERAILLGSYLPTIDVPAQGRWVTDPVGFAGKGRVGTGELASWFNPDQVLAPGVPVTAQGWQRSVTQPLPGGGNWVRFKQDIQDETGGSDWADSERFEVEPQTPSSE